jgi:sterol desaturase/sphingolipid hydroxylase (fatty acid hydroxylase superfamily)
VHQTAAIGFAAVAAGVMIAVERAMPGSVLPRVPGWWGRVVAINAFQVGIALLSGFTWNAWLQGASLFHASEWPHALGVSITYFVSTLVFYWWHRVRHESKFWWLAAHQIHHSARRLEVFTSFYKHPFEIALNSALSASICYPLMGCSVTQGAAYTLVIALAEMFYHWNVRTPRWIGIWVQRPESHRLHHRRFHHACNYRDLPLWDWLFGTFSNPSRADRVVCGFEAAKEGRFGAMLAMRPVDLERDSEPLSFRPACFGCSAKLRCASAREKISEP